MANRNLLHFLKMDMLDPSLRRIVWLPLAFMATSLVALAVLVPTYLMQPNWQTLIVLVSNIIVMGLNWVSYSLFRRGRLSLGAWLVLLTTWWNLALSGLFYQGLGIILSIAVIFLTLLVVTQVLSGRERIWAILIGVGVGYAIFAFDQAIALPLTWRIVTFSPQLAYPILGVMLLLALIFLASQYNNFNLTGKLIAAFLGITVVVAVLLAAIVLIVSQSRLRQLIGEQLQFNASSQAMIIGDDLNRQLSMLKSLSIDQTFVQAIDEANASYTGSQAENEAQVQQLDQEWIAAPDINVPLIWDRLNHPVARDLLGFRVLFPDHVEVFITDRYGAIVATTNRTSDYNQADEGWWQSAYQNGLGASYIGPPEFDESTQTSAVNMAIPVRNDANEVIGILRTTYNIRGITSVINSASFGESGEFDLVVPGDPDIVVNQGEVEPASSEILAIMQSLQNKGYIETQYEDAASLLSQALVRSVDSNTEISNLNWRLLSQQTTQEAFSPVQSQLRVSVIVIYLLVGVMAIVGYGVSLILSRPIVRLTRVAEQVSAGDLTARAVVESKDEIGSLARTFNSMTGQLSDMVSSLEQRVTDRTRALQTSTDVSRRLSTILDQNQLVREVVEQVQSAFGYYHAHIYLFDEQHENLVMVGGTGEAGQTLLARGHKIPRGRGLVGRAADTGVAVLVADTSQDPNWLPNPLLPETKSETAVPIMLGEQVLGVLDVQQNVVNGLAEADVDLLSSLASQVAIALQNARTLTNVQRQADREALIGAITQRIRASQTVDDALKITLQELGRVIGAPRSVVKLSAESDTSVQNA